MILDRLANHARYAGLHPGFPEAFAFLAALDIRTLPRGRVEIAGERLYAVVVDEEGRGEAGVRLETHRRYIDIQYQVSGSDRIGWAAAGDRPGAGYDPGKDVEFHAGDPEAWVTVPPGRFALFFPADVHAPLGGTGRLVKVVVKVKVD